MKPLVLLVDDDPEIRMAFSWILEKHFRMAEAKDGNEGLRKTLELKPDLIIADSHMPDCDGPDMIERIRAVPELNRIPIIVSSGSLNQEHTDRLERARVDFFLPKPFSVLELPRVINRVLARQHVSPAPPP